MTRDDAALTRVARALVERAKAIGISANALPAIAPDSFGSRALRMDAVGQPPTFELSYFERGLISTLESTEDEAAFVEVVMATVQGLRGMGVSR